jgi:integrase/recombinase XerD
MREPNLYRRAGIYWLRATINGVERRESLRTGDLKTARRLKDARIEEIKASRWRGERRRSWLECVAEWASHAHDQIGPKTAKRYAVSLEQVRPLLSTLDINQINGQVIADLICARRKAGASAATVRRDLTAISRVLEFAEAMGWREGNPTLSKRRILKERRDPIVLPEHADIETYIAAASPQFGGLIRAAWLTGCRQDELVTVTWRQFSHNRGTLEVIGKGNKRRTITLSADALALFASLPRALGSNLIFCKADREGFAQAASDFTHLRRAVLREAGKDGRRVGRFRFHDLRHLFAVEALRGGSMSIYALSKHLGHTSVKTTEIYLDFLTPEEADAARANSAQNTAQGRKSAV